MTILEEALERSKFLVLLPKYDANLMLAQCHEEAVKRWMYTYKCTTDVTELQKVRCKNQFTEIIRNFIAYGRVDVIIIFGKNQIEFQMH